MVRVERIVRPDKVQEEVEVYNDLLPRPGQVAATLFIEVTEAEKVQPVLDGLVGLDEPGKLVLRVGDYAYPAVFAAGPGREDRISAVHYLGFPLGEEGRRTLEQSGKADLEVRHGDYHARATLPPETVQELLADLSG